MAKRLAIHLIETLNCGGTENNLLRLLPELEKTGWQSVVLTLRQGGEMVSQFRQANIEVVELGQDNFLSPKTIGLLVQTLKKLQPDLVITNLLRADILGRLFLPLLVPFPIISYLHTTYNHPRYWSARLFEWLTQPLTLHYIANSKAVKDFYQRHLHVPARKLAVVEGGVDIEALQNATSRSVQRELKLPSQARVITCVGNLAPNKGQTYLIEAFVEVCGDDPNAYLLLIGEGENRAVLEAQRKESQAAKRILLLGRRTDVAQILKLTTIFALPTLFEGLSVALLEAMAAGKAIITTDIPENRVILTNNRSALLIKTGQTASLTEALRTLLKDTSLRERLATTALADVSKNYSMSAFATKFAKALTRACR